MSILRVEIDDTAGDEIVMRVSQDGPVWTMAPHTAADLRIAIQNAQVRRLEERQWKWDADATP